MSREELLSALAELGVIAPDDATDDELLQLLDAATAGRDAVDALGPTDAMGSGSLNLDENGQLVDEGGEPVDPAQGDVVADQTSSEPPAVEPPAEPPPPEEPAKGRGGRKAKPDPTELVSCVLGPNSSVGALVVGNARIEAKKAARIPRGEFDRLQREYDLVEVEG